MVSSVRERLAGLGWHRKQIVFERYGLRLAAVEASPLPARRIRFSSRQWKRPNFLFFSLWLRFAANVPAI